MIQAHLLADIIIEHVKRNEQHAVYALIASRDQIWADIANAALKAERSAPHPDGRDAVVEHARAVLARDAKWAPSGTAEDCNCINLSREAALEYETGFCPHQRLRAAIRAISSKPVPSAFSNILTEKVDP